MFDFEKAREAMVDCQVRTADVTRFAIIEAMLWAPRERFAPKAKRAVAYADAAVELAPGRVMLDARAFSKMLDAVDVGPGDLLLDVGCGTGYSAVVAARLASAVVALEEDEDLARRAAELVVELEVDNVIVERGPLADGWPSAGPYDVILVEGAAARSPDALIAQLKDGGRLAAIFVEGPVGQCRVATRIGDGASWRRVFDAHAPVLPGFDAAPEFQF